MDWPLFTLLKASTTVTSIIGEPPNMRFYWNRAPQDPEQPYVVAQIVGGEGPYNYFDQIPGTDKSRGQVDCYALDGQEAIDLATAVAAAIEPYHHMISAPATLFDDDAELNRVLLEFDLIVAR